jgi:predicted glycosyltransferase
MARESCLTGTPVIYTGGRYMSVNTELIKKGIFFEPDEEHSVMNLVGKVMEGNIKDRTREIVQQALVDEWEDTTEVIVNNVLEVLHMQQPKADPQ